MQFLAKTMKAMFLKRSRWAKTVLTKRLWVRSMPRRNVGHHSTSQIPEQHRPAGPPRGDGGHQTEAEFSVISIDQKCPGRHRTHTHDPQRSAPAARMPQSCIFLPRFIHWQAKSVPFEKLTSVPTPKHVHQLATRQSRSAATGSSLSFFLNHFRFSSAQLRRAHSQFPNSTAARKVRTVCRR